MASLGGAFAMTVAVDWVAVLELATFSWVLRHVSLVAAFDATVISFKANRTGTLLSLEIAITMPTASLWADRIFAF